MSRVLLIHGWSLDASLWDRVRPLLPTHECLTLDFGYFGPPHLEIPSDLDLVVGHSFGCMWAMLHPALAHLPLVAINGFPRFSAAPDFPHGTPERLLAHMLKRLREAPEEVLLAFRTRIGAPPPPATFHIERLITDLDRLRYEDARSLPKRQPILALATSDDPLLPLALSKQAFPESLRVLPEGGHLLPLNRPDTVAATVHEAINGGMHR